ncbi:chloramphenicol-sensitive protein RarD [Neisseria sp. HSC-16F19]|nr:EamA family transporter RarD [Neisseria sp. HSC-16F19]MCP2039933.1 chloramphenicol-sensitive protein RarD [Neisseria sp. HSC-16F19]
MSAPRTTGWNETQKGLAYALGSYLIWGLFPLYWYPLIGQPIGTDQLLAQRILWSALFSAVLMTVLRQWPPLMAALKTAKVWWVFALSSLLLSANWLTYLWAITHHHVLDASLGYFISPLVSIALGRLVYRDQLGRLQWLAVALAAVGVAWLTFLGGRVPWVALILSITWGLYGLLRKQAPLESLPGLTLETLLMLPLAAGYLLWTQQQGTLVFSQLPWLPLLLVIGSGAATALPLLLFAAAARRITLSSLGFVQYIGPTLQFMLGLWVFHEAFDVIRFVGYAWVWAGVALFAAASYRLRHRPSVKDT